MNPSATKNFTFVLTLLFNYQILSAQPFKLEPVKKWRCKESKGLVIAPVNATELTGVFHALLALQQLLQRARWVEEPQKNMFYWSGTATPIESIFAYIKLRFTYHSVLYPKLFDNAKEDRSLVRELHQTLGQVPESFSQPLLEFFTQTVQRDPNISVSEIISSMGKTELAMHFPNVFTGQSKRHKSKPSKDKNPDQKEKPRRSVPAGWAQTPPTPQPTLGHPQRHTKHGTNPPRESDAEYLKNAPERLAQAKAAREAFDARNRQAQEDRKLAAKGAPKTKKDKARRPETMHPGKEFIFIYRPGEQDVSCQACAFNTLRKLSGVKYPGFSPTLKKLEIMFEVATRLFKNDQDLPDPKDEEAKRDVLTTSLIRRCFNSLDKPEQFDSQGAMKKPLSHTHSLEFPHAEPFPKKYAVIKGVEVRVIEGVKIQDVWDFLKSVKRILVITRKISPELFDELVKKGRTSVEELFQKVKTLLPHCDGSFFETYVGEIFSHHEVIMKLPNPYRNLLYNEVLKSCSNEELTIEKGDNIIAKLMETNKTFRASLSEAFEPSVSPALPESFAKLPKSFVALPDTYRGDA